MTLMHAICLLAVLPMQSPEPARPASLGAATSPAGTSPSATDPARIVRFLELCETTRRGAILQLEHELRSQRNAAAANRSPVKIAQLESRLKDLRARRELVVPTLSFPPQAGSIGRLPSDACYVEQIVSPDEVLIRCHFRVPVTTVRDFRAYREFVSQPVPAIVRGWKQPLSEGQDTTTRDVFEVLGRETYATQGGAARTVLVLRPFNLAEVERYRPGAKSDASSRATVAEAFGG